jgi:hypothetical protein
VKFATSSGYELAGLPHHHFSAGLLVLMKDWHLLGIGQTKHIR